MVTVSNPIVARPRKLMSFLKRRRLFQAALPSAVTGLAGAIMAPGTTRESLRATASLPIRSRSLRTLALFAVTVVVVFVMALVQVDSDADFLAYVQSRDTQTPYRRPLHDLGHASLPTELPVSFADAPLWLLLAMTTAISAMVDPADRLRLVRRFSVLQIALYVMRTLTLLGTRLPPSDPKCDLRYIQRGSMIIAAMRMVASMDGACTDMIFSGHTATVVSLWAVWITHDRVHWSIKVTGTVVLLVCVVFFVATRLHYTVDVVLAFMLSLMTAAIYGLTWVIIQNEYPISRGLHDVPWYAKLLYWVEGADLVVDAVLQHGRERSQSHPQYKMKKRVT